MILSLIIISEVRSIDLFTTIIKYFIIFYNIKILYDKAFDWQKK